MSRHPSCRGSTRSAPKVRVRVRPVSCPVSSLINEIVHLAVRQEARRRHSRSYGNDERRRLAVKWAISYQRNLRDRALEPQRHYARTLRIRRAKTDGDVHLADIPLNFGFRQRRDGVRLRCTLARDGSALRQVLNADRMPAWPSHWKSARKSRPAKCSGDDEGLHVRTL